MIVGPKRPVTDVETHGRQLADFRLSLFCNDGFVEEGAGRNCLRSPALCLEELARSAGKRGDALCPGEIISTGSLTDAKPISAGEEWRAELNGLPLASLRVQFT